MITKYRAYRNRWSLLGVILAALLCLTGLIRAQPQGSSNQHAAPTAVSPGTLEGMAQNESLAEDVSADSPRIRLRLTDGSQIVAVSQLTEIPITTRFAKVVIPTEAIRRLTVKDDRGSAAIELLNGDRFTGVVALKSPIQMTAVVGEISVGLEYVKELIHEPGIMIEALIDGHSELHINAEGIHWVHEGQRSHKPGLFVGYNEPTWINGEKWFPEWENTQDSRGDDKTKPYRCQLKIWGQPRLELIAIAETRDATHLDERSPVTIRQEEEELIVDIPDGQPGARWYRFWLVGIDKEENESIRRTPS